MTVSPRRSTQGFTLLEFLVALVIVGIAMAFATPFLSRTMVTMRNIVLRHRIQSDAALLSNSVRLHLSKADPYSVKICSSGACPCSPSTCVVPAYVIPYSRIEFRHVGGVDTGAFYWNDFRAYVVEPRLKLSDPVRQPKLLARNVSAMMFSVNPKDLGLIKMSMRLDGPVIAGAPTFTMLPPDLLVQLRSSAQQ